MGQVCKKYTYFSPRHVRVKNPKMLLAEKSGMNPLEHLMNLTKKDGRVGVRVLGLDVGCRLAPSQWRGCTSPHGVALGHEKGPASSIGKLWSQLCTIGVPSGVMVRPLRPRFATWRQSRATALNSCS